MKRYVYHYCATTHKDIKVYTVDGIACLTGSIESMKCYSLLKEIIKEQNNIHGQITITSLSFLGMET
jgi:hypothetical protein